MDRESGILMHISSLPNAYGIGALGKEAYSFIDFLKKAGQSYWQVLPIGPTNFSNSPYQTFSIYAGNPYLIDLDLLKDEGLLAESDYRGMDFGHDNETVDYEKIFKNKLDILKIAYSRGKKSLSNQLKYFSENNSWVRDYALFMALREHLDFLPWQKWPKDIRLRKIDVLRCYSEKLKEEIEYRIFLQYVFLKQWEEFKLYANDKGIKIIGDIPIYVALNSVDTWVNNELFHLDQDKNPIKISGCPPDCFSSTGQLWGNPIYNWDVMEKNNFSWWSDRIRASLHLYDVIRIDHFRGFESYWEVPSGDKTAEYGQWVKGPGERLFAVIKQSLGKMNIIAEDLGTLTPEVVQLRDKLKYPGMKVLQFAFEDTKKESIYLPHYHDKNSVVYTGTHDNNTIHGWLENATPEQREYARNYLKLDHQEGYHWGFIRGAWSSVANLSIAPMQDFLGLGSQARMNTPSTTENNWKWRLDKKYLTEKLAKKILDLTILYGRFGEKHDING